MKKRKRKGKIKRKRKSTGFRRFGLDRIRNLTLTPVAKGKGERGRGAGGRGGAGRGGRPAGGGEQDYAE